MNIQAKIPARRDGRASSCVPQARELYADSAAVLNPQELRRLVRDLMG
jgi:hypothetical protein